MDITASVFLIVVGALAIAGLWYAASRHRTAALAGAATDTSRQLAGISEQLDAVNRRVAQVERILKDAE
jgi:predicted phage tail protein